MKVNSQDQICFIRDAPEHPIKGVVQTAPVANLATAMLAKLVASSAFVIMCTSHLDGNARGVHYQLCRNLLSQWGLL